MPPLLASSQGQSWVSGTVSEWAAVVPRHPPGAFFTLGPASLLFSAKDLEEVRVGCSQPPRS